MNDWDKYLASSKDSNRQESTLSSLDRVDQNGIPILDEVVEESVTPTHSPSNGTIRPHEEHSSQQDTEEAIRATLKAQLHDELNSITLPIITTAVEQAAARLETVIKDELTHSLHQRINTLIDDALKKQLDQHKS